MNVLTITGDRSFKKGHARFDLQASAVECFEAHYWGPAETSVVFLLPDILAFFFNIFGPSPKGPFDVVTAQDPFFRGLFGWIYAKYYGARFNVQVHADLKSQSFVKRVMAQFVLPRTDSVRSVSEETKKQAEAMGAKKVTVLPVFVDVEPFKTIKRSLGKKPTILWIGRFEDEKDPLRAIDILKQIREKGVDAKLIMLGKGTLENKLRKRAENFPVEFPGWQNSIEYLPQAHVVLSTSRAESWGASIVEALAAGVPVVAPDVGIAKEAGAVVVKRDKLAETVMATLETKSPGKLKIPVLSKEEWVAAWRSSLV